MPEVIVPLAQSQRAMLDKKLDELNKQIQVMERRKLITIIEPGSSDKVVYVEPYDPGKGNDPEELVEVVEARVVSTDYSQGYARTTVENVKTGVFKKRWQLDHKFVGPFGPTYKIDSSNQNGDRELADFKRVLSEHVSRFSKVPDPVSYHSEVNELGMLDLKNISITKDDVPVAVLENYEPLMKLVALRDAIVAEIEGGEKVDRSQIEDSFKCEVIGCGFSSESSKGLAVHKKHSHK